MPVRGNSPECDESFGKLGRYGDGDGLFLEVGGKRAASWIVRVQKNGRRRDFGLGALSKVPLAMARERARQIRMQVEAGLDPVIERRKSAGMPTFRQAAAEVHAEHKRSWRNGKHQAQWINTLTTYAFPQIGEVAIDKVELGHACLPCRAAGMLAAYKAG